jgi:hypothetical protein
MEKLLTTLVLGLAAAPGVQAQAWPSKPVTLVVPNTMAEFTAFQQQEFARWKKVIEVGKITAD